MANVTTKEIKAEGTASVAADRKPPIIPTANVHIDSQGQRLRRFVIRLPDGFTRSDLMETEEPWRKIQAGSWALRKHDELYCLSYDESWVAEVIVSDANARAVTLAKPRFTELTSRIKSLLNGGKFKVEWAGTGYVVVRIADNHRMTQAVASEVIANRELANLYPRTVAAA